MESKAGGYPHDHPMHTSMPQPMHTTMSQPMQAHVYPPPPPPYDTNENLVSQPVYTQQPQLVQTIITAPHVGPDPSAVVCPSCHKQIVTRIDHEVSTKTHIIAGILCLFVCWPCFWIPYVVDSCKNANHYCPSCGAFIGSYKN
uniref:Putative membrane-associated motif in lps-induced tumor necrosis factor alpha factor n=1 Tax=Corethrella appendiculata TaxID=1370023 RepID=U5EHN6_9DIPT